jgi:hypothetical protein
MNDEDKKLIEEAERLDAEATPGWASYPVGFCGYAYETVWAKNVDDEPLFESYSQPDTRFVVAARTLLPQLAKRLREALNVPDVPPEPPKLPEPLVDGYYWVRLPSDAPIIAERETYGGRAHWFHFGADGSDNVEPLFGPLQPPAVTNTSPIVPWPVDLPPRFNGGVQCDALEGPCACGAWHSKVTNVTK